jgi:curved DNA-binding protein CbpA
MGASQSSSSSPGNGGSGGRPRTSDGVDVQDYYTLLELPDPNTSTSSSEEIRKGYRKLALRYHPDKNPDNVEEANKRFLLIQAAYEILSDDQERAWYDAHREQILGGTMDEDELGGDEEGLDEETFQSFRNGSRKPPPAPTGSSLPGLTTRQLMRFLDATLCLDIKPPSADESGFFGIYRRLFERLLEEEKGAAPYPGEKTSEWEPFPSFGYCHTPYLHPKGEEKPIHQDQVRDFYTAWSSFASRKGFQWKDGHRLHDAPDRRVRRAMEKENKRMRDEARREYNDVIRSLVNFIRKRDPRLKAHLATQTASANSSEELQRRKLAAEREMREQEERAKAFRQQSWDVWNDGQEVESEDDSEASFGEEVLNNRGYGEEGEEEEKEEEDDLSDEEFDDDVLECFACDKIFQSLAAFDNHEKSNKHKKQVQQITRQMQKEDRAFRKLNGQVEEKLVVVGIEEEEEQPQPQWSEEPEKSGEKDDTAGLSKKAKQRLKKRLKDQEKAATSTAPTSENEQQGEEEERPDAIPREKTAGSSPDAAPKNDHDKGNAKTKRTKKEKKMANAKEHCNVCQAGFDSRSKLFTHVRETNHALAASNSSSKR